MGLRRIYKIRLRGGLSTASTPMYLSLMTKADLLGRGSAGDQEPHDIGVNY